MNATLGVVLILTVMVVLISLSLGSFIVGQKVWAAGPITPQPGTSCTRHNGTGQCNAGTTNMNAMMNSGLMMGGSGMMSGTTIMSRTNMVEYHDSTNADHHLNCSGVQNETETTPTTDEKNNP